MVQPDRAQVTIQCMPIEFWITKATDTNSVYVTRTVVYRQQCLEKSPTCYVHTYIAFLVKCIGNLFSLLLCTAISPRGKDSLYNYSSIVTRNLILNFLCIVNLQIATEIHLELF
jgi:hypothetical protein